MVTTMSSGVFDPQHRVGPLPSAPGTVVLGARPLPAVGTARIYVCGITPYDVTHLGHAATFVWADLLATAFETTGATSRLVRNVTDIDDVLTQAARARGRHYDELALSQESVFDQSMRALRVATPAAQPRARHHVEAIQQLAHALLERGAAYEADGWVFFDGRPTSERVAQAHHLDLGEQHRRLDEVGDQPDHPSKRDASDVAIWRPSSPEDPAWPSPWGWGRPGWHAECAAMALAHQGGAVDVLVGGDDLAYPHHHYQAALAEAATGAAPFARAQLHIGTVHVRGRRMAKSTGNLVLVDDLLTSWSPAELRLALLDRPATEPWEFECLDRTQVAARLESLYRAAARTTDAPIAPVLERLRTELDVTGALDLATEHGGDAARRLIALLRLG